MKRDDEIILFFQKLQNEGILSTKDFLEDIRRIITSDVNNFVKKAYKALSRINLDYSKFETLKLTNIQRKKMEGNLLRRYEYRKNINLKCIFFIQKEDNVNIPILLCAFIEDGDKSKGKDSYKHNIDREVNIYEKGKI